jgi:hypothetical protein
VTHFDKVNKISGEVTEAFNNKRSLYIFHGSSNTTREINFKLGAYVDISDLDNILEVNVEGSYAIVEPNVSIGALVSETFKKGLVPPVVMEFPGITLGGAVQGGAAESSSFKYSLLHQSALEYEVILGNGQVANVSRTNNSELFWSLACSYGTLAIITKIKLRLIKATKFVKINYMPVKNSAELIEIIKLENANENNDFLDGILFSQKSGVVMAGIMTDVNDSGQKEITFSKPNDDWFYLHVLSKTKKGDFSEDIMSLNEYLFRYNRGAFWVGKFFFSYFKLPFLKITRRLFNGLLNAKSLYSIIHATNKSQLFLVQDFNMPQDKSIEFLEYVEQNFPTHPLWICPLLSSTENDKLAPNHIPTKLGINIGIYTKIGSNYERFLKINRDLELTAKKLGGRKTLYAHQYYTSDEFWQIYDKKWYEDLRVKCSAQNVFPDVYQKTFVKKKYKPRFWKGISELLK